MGRKKRSFETFEMNENGRDLPKPMFSEVASGEELAKLDDAIRNHGGPFEKTFLELLGFAEHVASWGRPWDAEARLRTTTLRHCWTQMNWRPSKTCKYVYVKNNNNY